MIVKINHTLMYPRLITKIKNGSIRANFINLIDFRVFFSKVERIRLSFSLYLNLNFAF